MDGKGEERTRGNGGSQGGMGNTKNGHGHCSFVGAPAYKQQEGTYEIEKVSAPFLK